MPYQERQTFDDEDQQDAVDDAPPQRGSPKFVTAVVLITMVAAGIATSFALMHSP